MIPTVAIDLQTTFEVGVLFALVAVRQIQTEHVSGWSRYVKAGFWFGIAYGLGVSYWCFEYADWMWVYSWDTTKWSTWIWYPPFVLALGLAGAAGTWMGQLAIVRRGLWGGIGLAVVALWMHGTFWLVMFEEYSNLATLAEWNATPRISVPTAEDPNWATGASVMGVIMVLVAGQYVVRFVHEGRRLSRI